MAKRLAMVVIMAIFISLAFSNRPASAADLTLTYANFPPAATFPCVQMERWKQEVEQRTNGKVEIKTFPGGALLGAKNMLEGVKQGQADIGNLCMPYQPGVFPLTSVLEVPMGLKSAKVASAILYDLVEKFDPKEFAEVKILAVFTSAPSNISSTTPVKSLDDLKGLELRASGGAADILRLLQAIDVNMPMSDTPEALQKSVVKGLLSSLEVLKDLNYAEQCRHITMLNAQVYPFAVVMNKSKWEALPDDVKKVFDDMRQEQSVWTGEYADKHTVDALAWADEKYGIQTHYFNEDEMKTMAERLEPMATEWKQKAAKAGLDAEAIWKAVQERKDFYEQTTP